jgi:hypothetical protein
MRVEDARKRASGTRPEGRGHSGHPSRRALPGAPQDEANPKHVCARGRIALSGGGRRPQGASRLGCIAALVESGRKLGAGGNQVKARMLR